jgi:hypothetical protein
MAADDHGWRLLQLAELLRALESHEGRALTILRQVVPTVGPTFALTLKRAQIAELHHAVAEVAQLAEQAEALIDVLPHMPIPIAYGDLRISAEHVLSRSGTLDSTAVLIAARLLDRRTGLRALAEALRAGDSHAFWDEISLSDLLTAFRGVSPQLARRIATAARLAPGTAIEDCGRDDIARLADQLDHHAEG